MFLSYAGLKRVFYKTLLDVKQSRNDDRADSVKRPTYLKDKIDKQALLNLETGRVNYHGNKSLKSEKVELSPEMENNNFNVLEYFKQCKLSDELIGNKDLASSKDLQATVNMFLLSNVNGQTPLHNAVLCKDLRAIRIILNCGICDFDIHHGRDCYIISEFLLLVRERNDLLAMEDCEIIKTLMNSGARTVYDHSDINDPLFYAMEFKNSYNLIVYLCQRGADVNAFGFKRSQTALMVAAQKGLSRVVSLFIKQGARINNGEMFSALNSALKHGRVDCAELLIQHGADVNIRTALYLAVESQKPESLLVLIKHFQREINSEMVDVGKQLLRVAVQKKNRELIRLLVQCGADVTPSCYSIQAKLWLPPHPCVVEELVSLCSGASSERFYGRSLLEYLLNNYHIITYKFPKEKFLDKVKSIVKNGVSLETLNKYDHTPLMRSVIIRNLPQLTRIFLEAGADVNRQNNEGKTALHFAAESGSVKLVNVLLEFNANVNLQCSLGRTPLSTAVVNDDDKIICCLLANGADVNIADHEGNTPLLISCRSIKKNVDVLKLLVKAGSDVDHQNNDGRTALMLAAELQDFDMVHTLCLSGADVNVANLTHNETALSILFSSPKLDEGQDLKCIDFLIQYGSKNLCLVPNLIHKCFLYNRVSYIKHLILYGVGPEDIEIQHNNVNSTSYLVHVSPIQLALMHGYSNIAQIFQQMWFFTKSDIHILMNNNSNNSKLREILSAKGYLPCIEFLDKMKRQPLSLQELSFLTVSQAVGSDIGRKQRVRQLGFPQVVQNKLMFEEVEDFTFGDDS